MHVVIQTARMSLDPQSPAASKREGIEWKWQHWDLGILGAAHGFNRDSLQYFGPAAPNPLRHTFPSEESTEGNLSGTLCAYQLLGCTIIQKDVFHPASVEEPFYFSYDSSVDMGNH